MLNLNLYSEKDEDIKMNFIYHQNEIFNTFKIDYYLFDDDKETKRIQRNLIIDDILNDTTNFIKPTCIVSDTINIKL